MSERMWRVEFDPTEGIWAIYDHRDRRRATVAPGPGHDYDIEYELVGFGQAGREVRFIDLSGFEEVRVV